MIWCNTHNREATGIVAEGLWDAGKPRCAYGLPGILLPCSTVDLTDIMEIEDDRKMDITP
jgi:hypothetical protein